MGAGVIKTIAISLLIILCCPVMGKTTGVKESVSFLEATVNHDKAVEGERLIYEVTLYSTDPSIAGIEMIAAPDFAGFDARRSAADLRLTEIARGGVKYYAVVIDRFFLSVNGKGRHLLRGGGYVVGFNRRVAVNDPFWGPGYANKVETTELSAPDITVKVSALPEKNRPDMFSGAVGNFDVTVTVPHGEIRAGEEAYVVVTVSGEGDLSEISPLDVMSAFRNGLHFRSMTENRSEYVSKGNLGSEIEMECVFVSDKPGTYTIEGISFVYFNPRTRKYEEAKSSPVVIDVGSGVSTKSASPVYMDI